MKITKIIAEWDNGKRYSIEEPEVTQLLRARGNEEIHKYLQRSFALNLTGGFDWKEEEEEELDLDEIVKCMVGITVGANLIRVEEIEC